LGAILGSILVPFSAHFGVSILVPFWSRFGGLLGSIWKPFWELFWIKIVQKVVEKAGPKKHAPERGIWGKNGLDITPLPFRKC
jgi:hypothetical protein